MSPPRVLCVDDDTRLLDGMARVLSEDFDVVVAHSGADGLMRLEQAPVSVVVSDMRMPGMDGATFLARVRVRVPDVSRILLTGQSDMRDAIRAVNDGQLFRFLLKPCPADELAGAIRAGVEHHRLVTAERELLEETVNGVIRLLVDVLALAAPAAFRAAGIAKVIVHHLEKKLGRPPSWKIEAAAMLSSLGCIAVPPDVLTRVLRGGAVSAADRALFNRHPETGSKLLTAVPRLDEVAAIVARQNERGVDAPGDEVSFGAALVRVGVVAAELILEGKKPHELPGLTRPQLAGFDATLSEFLADVVLGGENGVERVVLVDGLRPGMHLVDAVRAKNGALLVQGGQQLTAPLVERLRRFAEGVGVDEPIRVIAPS